MSAPSRKPPRSVRFTEPPMKRRRAEDEQRVDEEEPEDGAALAMSRDKYSRIEAEAAAAGNAARVKEDDVSKHTLDSDEEEEDKYQKLDIRKVEGQEDATQEYEGMTKITPFNMNDEMEDGHFDSTGNFIFKKGANDVKDAWLDNVDWARIKKDAGGQWQQTEADDDSQPTEMDDNELKKLYDQLLAILQPQETIAAAIRRVGGASNRLSAAEERKRRWAAKKAGQTVETDSNVTELTALADTLVSRGDMEAYQLTREKVKLLREGQRAVDDLDIFSDQPSSSSTSASGNKSDLPASSEVMWEYRLKNNDDAELFGPVDTQEMMRLQAEDKFGNGGWARRSGTNAFYSVARVDFELYA